MRPRTPQLALPGGADNDAGGLDAFMAGAKLCAADRALVAAAPPELQTEVAARLASGRDHAQAGREAHAAGDEWQDVLIAQHVAMAQAPGDRELLWRGAGDRLLAWHFQVHPEAKYCRGRGGEKVLKHVAKAAADFVMLSTFDRGCVPVVVEAKSVKHTPAGQPGRLSVDEIAPQQKDHLAETVRAGGLALVAVEFRLDAGKGRTPRLARFAVPWDEIPWRPVRKGSWSIGHDDLAGWEMPPETGPRRAFYLARFLPRAPTPPAPPAPAAA